MTHLSMAASLPLALLLAPACDGVDLSQFNRVAMEVLLLHSPDLAAEYGLDNEVGETTAIEIYLLQALGSGESGNKVSGAVVRVTMPDGTAVQLDEIEPGRYRAVSTERPALYYQDRGEYQVMAVVDGRSCAASARAYVGTTITEPASGTQVEPNVPLTLSLADEADAVLVLVYDEQGQEVYSDAPTDGEDLLALITGGSVSEATIDGRTFEEGHVYLVGAAGLEASTWLESSDSFAPGLSSFASGSLDAVAVVTMPLQGLAGVFMSVQGEGLEEFGISMEEHAEALLYGARIELSSGLEQQPITGGHALISSGTMEVLLQESDDTPGLYQVSSDDVPGLSYVTGRGYSMQISEDGESWSLAMEAPEPPVIAEPEPQSYHEAGTNLVLTVPEEHELYFAAVVDSSGEILWDDLPDADNAEQIFTGEHGTPPGGHIELPGAVFTLEGQVFGVGLMGLDRIASDHIPDDLNAEFSDLYLGTTAFTAVTTLQLP